MKRILIITAALAFVCSSANAQSFLEKLGQKALDKAASRTESAADRAVDKAFDAVEGLFSKKDKKEAGQEAPADNQQTQSAPAAGSWTCPECGKTGNTGNFCDDCGAKKPGAGSSASAQSGWNCPECGKTGNTGNFCADCGARKPGAGTQASEPKKPAASAVVWNNYDFVAGDEIIHDDNLEGEQMGEFPSRMDLFQGNCQIVTIDGIKCINSEDGIFTPLFDEPYLTDAFTIEFDVYIYDYDTFMKNHPDQWVGSNNYAIELASTENISRVDTSPDQEAIYLEIEATAQYEDLNSPCKIYYEWYTPAGDRREGSFRYELHGKYNCFHHVAISFNKRACKIYFDEQRVANIPNAKAPKWVQFQGAHNWPGLYFWKNFRIAKGAVPLYERVQGEGKIVTYGITFDTGKATIKPESTGEINRIRDLMNQDPGIKFEVQGHCDNTGSAAVNDKLSQQRAEAIVAALVGQGISADRLTAVGKGSSTPIADNSTDEGRAKNRRVEFIKK